MSRPVELAESEEEGNEKETAFACEDCDQRFATLKGLRIHQSRTGCQREKSAAPPSTPPEATEPATCEGCGRTFATLHGCRVHRAFCDAARAIARDADTDGDAAAGGRAEFECDGCGKRFTTQKGCRAHKTRYCLSRPAPPTLLPTPKRARVANDRCDADTDDDEPDGAAARAALPRVPPNTLFADALKRAEQAAQLPAPLAAALARREQQLAQRDLDLAAVAEALAERARDVDAREDALAAREAVFDANALWMDDGLYRGGETGTAI